MQYSTQAKNSGRLSVVLMIVDADKQHNPKLVRNHAADNSFIFINYLFCLWNPMTRTVLALPCFTLLPFSSARVAPEGYLALRTSNRDFWRMRLKLFGSAIQRRSSCVRASILSIPTQTRGRHPVNGETYPQRTIRTDNVPEILETPLPPLPGVFG